MRDLKATISRLALDIDAIYSEGGNIDTLVIIKNVLSDYDTAEYLTKEDIIETFKESAELFFLED